MRVREGVAVIGIVSLVFRRADGSKQMFRGRNVVTETGFKLIARRLAGNSDAIPDFIALGDDNTIQTVQQTALVGTELFREQGTVEVTDNVFKVSKTFGPFDSSEPTLGEIGIFNDASAGDMLCRFTTPEITLAEDSELDVTWSVFIGGEIES